ncbi:hypothetical protein BX070DRAFT_235032 [Coemansia spiralis]|nr:hypothetical protein BX070DRAFT_235032 [Coemansia spiralis]
MTRRGMGSRARRRAHQARIRAGSWPHSERASSSRIMESTGNYAFEKENRSQSALGISGIGRGSSDLADGEYQPEKVNFLTNPFKVSYYSTLYLKGRIRTTAGYIVQYPLTLAYSIALGSIYTALHFVAGPHVEIFRRADAWVGWHLYWIILGVLSSIGLGAGLHTFVLFLGPHIARVTLTAHECSSTSFAVHGPGAFQCGARGSEEAAAAAAATFMAIMHKVIFESLCWGAGTAIGELPPYFIARAASAAGQGNVEYQRLKRKAAVGGSLSFKDRALLSIYSLLRRFGFAGILLFAAIPNPLFDLAGITCGHFKVPFWTFFGATFIGKSIFKSSIQTAVVITAFSKEMIAVVLSFLSHVSPWARDLAEHVLSQQAAAYSGHSGGRGSGGGSKGDGQRISIPDSNDDADASASSLSFLGSVWNACVSIMLIYFAISTLETFAQSYLAEVKSWGQNQLARVGNLQKQPVNANTNASSSIVDIQATAGLPKRSGSSGSSSSSSSMSE